MLRYAVAGFVVLGFIAAAGLGQTTQPSTKAIDACGTLVQATECVLFETGGKRYVLSDYGHFRAGDSVRVVGTADSNCVTICSEGDGCIRGAVVYDPSVFPCGTPIEVPFDPCSGLGTSLLGFALIGFHFARVRRNR